MLRKGSRGSVELALFPGDVMVDQPFLVRGRDDVVRLVREVLPQHVDDGDFGLRDVLDRRCALERRG